MTYFRSLGQKSRNNFVHFFGSNENKKNLLTKLTDLKKANEISIKLYELLYFVALHIIVGKVTSNRTYEDIVLPELDFCWYCKMKTVFEP